MAIEVRAATTDDAADLARLVGAFRDSLGAALPTDEDVAGTLPAVLADPGWEFLCGRLDGRSVGYAATRNNFV